MDKAGICGFDASPVEKYPDFIDEKTSKIDSDLDTIDTSLILSNKKKYLPILLYNSQGKIIYKLYSNKQALLDDNYSILSLSNDGNCEVFANSPWVIYSNGKDDGVEIMSEKISNGQVDLIKAFPSESSSDMCSLFPLLNVRQPKSYFYDSSHKVKKSYLIKGDVVNLSSIGKDGKWCKVRYVNIKNKTIDSIMPCSDLSI